MMVSDNVEKNSSIPDGKFSRFFCGYWLMLVSDWFMIFTLWSIYGQLMMVDVDVKMVHDD